MASVKTKTPALIYQIKITLKDAKPSIWRRILVSGDTNLHILHDIIQTVMGWEDYHLHQFRAQGQRYADKNVEGFGEMGEKDENRYILSQIATTEKTRFEYEYDFGDSWEHTILVEKIFPPKEGEKYPVCIKGVRACPPEDVGGVWGYEEFLETINDPENPEHEETLDWAGGEFDAEYFDVDEMNARFRVFFKK